MEGESGFASQISVLTFATREELDQLKVIFASLDVSTYRRKDNVVVNCCWSVVRLVSMH